MLSERLQSQLVRHLNKRYLGFTPVGQGQLPGPTAGQDYMLYMHVPFCERLCPYCSFNRYPFEVSRATVYFQDLRREMQLLAERGYDFQSLYIGGGTPTVMPGELVQTIDYARQLFSVKEVSCETNPNHLTADIVSQLKGRVQRLSVGVQSFDDGLLRQMERFGKYGSGLETLQRIQAVQDDFQCLNIDMIFNFPSQTEDILINDLAGVLESGASQVTFYPLMTSPTVAASLARTVGKVDYAREKHYYDIVSEVLTGFGTQTDPSFTFSSAWTFNRRGAGEGVGAAVREETHGATVSEEAAGREGAHGAHGARDDLDAGSGAHVSQSAHFSTDSCSSKPMIDEYIVDYEEYPAIGSGGMSYLNGSLFVNTFSLDEYHQAIAAGRLSVSGVTHFSRYDRMRYRLMMQLFSLRLDKRQWQNDFGCSVAQGVPAEYLFFKSARAIAYEDQSELIVSPKGRYLTVALMREFFSGVNLVRDQARAALPAAERKLLFGEQELFGEQGLGGQVA